MFKDVEELVRVFPYVYEQKMLKNAVQFGTSQYVVFKNSAKSNSYVKPNWAKSLKVFELSNPLNKNWFEELCNTEFDRRKTTFVSLLGISGRLPKLAFCALINRLSKLMPEGSSLLFDFCEKQPRAYLAQYNLLEIQAIMTMSGLLIYENISPKELAKICTSQSNGIKIDEIGATSYILAVKK